MNPVDFRSWLAAVVESSDDAIISKNLDGVISTWNLAAQQLFGYSEQEAIGQPVTIIIPADLHDEEKEILRRVRLGQRIDHYETRRVTRDGRIVDVSITVSPVRDAAGAIVGASKILRQVTANKRDRAALERRLAEKAQASIDQQLIDAHEEERRGIARELHNDILQRLALLTISLDALAHGNDGLTADGKQELEETRETAMDLARDVQALSHRLHPARLEFLGLSAAAAGLCREISDVRGVQIRFEVERVPDGVSKRVAVCLYRVLQEALQNAVKHSGVRGIEVSLRGGVDEIELTVRDLGAGFDVPTSHGRGLGLISMKERVRAVRGRLAILSEPQVGTTVYASVPLAWDD